MVYYHVGLLAGRARGLAARYRNTHSGVGKGDALANAPCGPGRGETGFPLLFRSGAYAAAPHNDRMNNEFFLGGHRGAAAARLYAQTLPAGRLCSPQTLIRGAHNAAMTMGYLWEGRPLPGPPPLGFKGGQNIRANVVYTALECPGARLWSPLSSFAGEGRG